MPSNSRFLRIKLRSKLFHHIQRLNQMLKRHLIPFPHSKRMSRPNRILNLPPIDIPQSQRVNLLRSDGARSPDLGDESCPDLNFRFLRKIVKMESHVNTGEEGFVECLDTIGGEEEDTTVVFDVTETLKKIWQKKSETILFLSISTYNTATIAFLSRSCIDLRSRKTSACKNINCQQSG